MSSIIAEFKKKYNEYGFQILVIGSVMLIIILFLKNLCTGSSGKYSWYREVQKPPKKVVFSLDESDIHTSKLELKAKMILESIFHRPFKKIRPDFLHNPVTGKNLELDLYNHDLKLACEVNGNQHYKYTPFFHSKGKEQFYNQQYRDEIKKMKCKENGICLIAIPYDVGDEGIKDAILNELRKNRYLV